MVDVVQCASKFGSSIEKWNIVDVCNVHLNSIYLSSNETTLLLKFALQFWSIFSLNFSSCYRCSIMCSPPLCEEHKYHLGMCVPFLEKACLYDDGINEQDTGRCIYIKNS